MIVVSPLHLALAVLVLEWITLGVCEQSGLTFYVMFVLYVRRRTCTAASPFRGAAIYYLPPKQYYYVYPHYLHTSIVESCGPGVCVGCVWGGASDQPQGGWFEPV